MDIFETEVLGLSWFIWGLGLMISVPVIIVVLNELGLVFNKRSKMLSNPTNTIKNVVIPLIAVTILFTKVLNFSRDSIGTKLLETLVWVVAINAALSVITILFFSEKGKEGKAKVPQLFLDIFRIAMVLVGMALVLSEVWNADLGGLITALGLGSFVLGLALQDTLGNLFSGIALVYEKPFAEGDWISVGDKVGIVKEMNWRAIRMLTRERELIIIPHLVIGQSAIKNYSRPTKIHLKKQELGFSYSIEPNKVKSVLKEVCLSVDGILPLPEPEVKLLRYGESKIIYEVEFAIDDYLAHEEILDQVMTKAWYASSRHKLIMPLPQLDIHRSKQETDEAIKGGEDSVRKQLINMAQFFPREIGRHATDDQLSQMLKFGEGEFIIHQKDSVGKIYIVLEGAVLLTSKVRQKKLTVGELKEGDFFGELAILGSKTNFYSAMATEDVEVLVLDESILYRFFEENPTIAHQFNELIDSRKKQLVTKMRGNES